MFSTKLSAFWQKLRAFWWKLRAFWWKLGASWCSSGAFWCSSGAFWCPNSLENVPFIAFFVPKSAVFVRLCRQAVWIAYEHLWILYEGLRPTLHNATIGITTRYTDLWRDEYFYHKNFFWNIISSWIKCRFTVEEVPTHRRHLAYTSSTSCLHVVDILPTCRGDVAYMLISVDQGVDQTVPWSLERLNHLQISTRGT